MFMLEGNVRHNKAIVTDYQPLTSPQMHTGTLLCDRDKHNSANVYFIHANDSLTSQSISQVQVSYSCGDESCVLGSTNEFGNIVTKLPVCFGGKLTMKKYNYLGQSIPLSTSIEIPDGLPIKTITMELIPILEVPFKVEKKQVGKAGDGIWVVNPNALNLKPKEEMIITLTRHKDNFNEDFTSAAIIQQGNNEEQIIRIAPGMYDLDASLFLYDLVIIPEEERSEDFTEYTIPEIVFGDNGSAFPEGGLELDNVSMSKDKFLDLQYINFYLVAFFPDDFYRIEDLDVITLVDLYSEENRAEFLPKFVK